MRLLIPLTALLAALCLWPPVANAATAGNPENIEQIQAAVDPDSFSFIVLGDSVGGDDVFAALIEQINALEPDFVWHLGDVATHGKPEEFDSYFEIAAGIDVPMVAIPGNHDVRDSLDVYVGYFGVRNWSFDIGESRFIGLDNSNYRFDTETLDFAKAKLDTDKPCYIAFHCPPHIERWAHHGMRPDENKGRGREMIDVIGDSNAQYVFLGHIHLHDQMEIRGVPYVICGGGGSALHSRYGFGIAEHGFLHVRVINKKPTIRWISLKSG